MRAWTAASRIPVAATPKELPTGMTSAAARHAHRRFWQQLKGRPAEW